MLFDSRVDVGEGANSTGDRDSRYFRSRIFETLEVARKLGIVAGEFDPKGRRFGVDCMAATNSNRIPVFQGAFF